MAVTPGVRATAPFDEAGHLLVDRLRCRPGVVGADGDHRLIDVRQLAHLDPAKGGHAGDDDENAEHDREHRPADEQSGDAAGQPALAAIVVARRHDA